MSEKSPAQKAAEALEKERERQRIAQINAQINSNNESIVNYNNWKDSCVSIKSEMTNAVNAWKTAKEEFGKCSIASTVKKKNVFYYVFHYTVVYTLWCKYNEKHQLYSYLKLKNRGNDITIFPNIPILL